MPYQRFPSTLIINGIMEYQSSCIFSRFKAMQSMMEQTLKKSLDIKNDKIDALETRYEGFFVKKIRRFVSLKEEIKLNIQLNLC